MHYNTEGKNILEKMNKSPMKYINTVSLRYRYDLISKKKKKITIEMQNLLFLSLQILSTTIAKKRKNKSNVRIF